jgi:lipopolysaccharide transport system permease protein
LSALLFPFTLLPLVLLILGITWGLAALGVYLRDVTQFIGIIITALLFLSPVFYPANALPPQYQPLLMLNPLGPAIEAARDVLFWGKLPDLAMLASHLTIGAIVAWIGFAGFQRSRRGFSDVL